MLGWERPNREFVGSRRGPSVCCHISVVGDCVSQWPG